MPTGHKGQKRPADVFGNAVRVIKIATGGTEETPSVDDGKPRSRSGLGVRVNLLALWKRRRLVVKEGEQAAALWNLKMG